MISLPECVAWLTVGLIVTVAIVTLNLITIIVFVNNGNFWRRSTYMVINLKSRGYADWWIRHI